MFALELLLLGFFRPPGTRLLFCNVVYTCQQQQIVMLLYVAGLNLVMIPLLIIYVVKGGDPGGTQESTEGRA